LLFRIEDARPKVIVSASCGIEGSKIIPYKPLLDKAIRMSGHKPEKCIILARPQAKAELQPGRDSDWDELMEKAEPAACVPVKATDPLYILYTSGTTGKPKGVVRDNGGHAVAMCWSMKAVYGVNPGEVFWAASDVGWQAAHSYMVYAPLMYGCTTVVYEGKPVGTPDAGAFWQVISQHKVKAMFTAPTALRAVRKEDPDGELLKKYDIGCFDTMFPAGERLDSDTYHWIAHLLKRPIVDHYWQTEMGWPVACNCMGIEVLPIKPGSPTKPVPGYGIGVFDSSGNELGPDRSGSLAIRLPLPPGSFISLWNADEHYVKSYFSEYPGYYITGDGGFLDRDGYLFILGRIDDVINVAGHRLSTGEMEEVIAGHPAVAECAVVGAADGMKGQVPIGLVVPRSNSNVNAESLSKELANMVREAIGPIACYKETIVVRRLPKTRSGKILRTLIRELADGRKVQVPATIEDIEDPDVIGEIEAALLESSVVKRTGS
jgi:propionyl-CoA synthetase